MSSRTWTRFCPLEFRAETDGRILRGVLVRYGDVATVGGVFKESIRAGAFGESLRNSKVTVNIQHDRARILARNGNGLELTENPVELAARIELPVTRIAEDCLELVRASLLTGLSVEMTVEKEDWPERDRREITKASLVAIGVVDNPAYSQSVLQELRSRWRPEPTPRKRPIFL